MEKNKSLDEIIAEAKKRRLQELLQAKEGDAMWEKHAPILMEETEDESQRLPEKTGPIEGDFYKWGTKEQIDRLRKQRRERLGK